MLSTLVFTVTLLTLTLRSIEVPEPVARSSFDLPEPVATSTSSPIGVVLRRRRGRPRKFEAPSRAVTLTLPESVIAALSAADPDLSRAIVRLAERRVARVTRRAAELATFGRRAVITVQPTRSLEKRAGIDLVPLPDGRALISFEQPTTIADIELTLGDALEDPELNARDRRVFEGIGEILKEARRSRDVTVLRRTIIVLESAGPGEPANSTPRRHNRKKRARSR